jgi:hypothetical protein
MDPDILGVATAGRAMVPPDWLPACQVRPLIIEDPVLLWLEYHGAQFGFQPDTSPYAFADFVAETSRQFEAKWLLERANAAPAACQDAREVVCGRRLGHHPAGTSTMTLRVTPVM